MNNSLMQITLRLQPAIHGALSRRASDKGQELADYISDQLANFVIKDLDRDERERMMAELEVKSKVIDFAKEETKNKGFDPDIILKAFQHIRTNNSLQASYKRAIGNRPVADRGNHTKARINRTIGSTIKSALGAATQKKTDGSPDEVQVGNEFILSYSRLEQGRV
jgi:hypothetical protein